MLKIIKKNQKNLLTRHKKSSIIKLRKVKKIKIYRRVRIMRKVAEMNETRENFVGALTNLGDTLMEGAVLVGRTSEGLVYETEEGYTVLKVIVKKADFDLEDALAEYKEKLEAQAKKKLEAEVKKSKSLAKKAKEKAGA